jgi:3-hydroxyisobutyrate dehydrogenase
MGRVGFVGLGVMGEPMAGHLLRQEGQLVVWNRTPSKADALVSQGATVAASLADLASTCSLVFLCVSRTEDVEQCLSEMATQANPGTLFVDHSTISPNGAKALHKDLARRGLRFLDAPITGGSAGAQKGALTIFCGGSEPDFQEAELKMKAYAKRAELTGGPGSGQLTKMANQIAVAGSLMGLCESLAFAEKAGIDPRQTWELISSGAAGSWAMENYGPKLLARDWTPGFTIENQRKDFGYCQEAAQEAGCTLPMTSLCDEMLRTLHEAGHGGWTTASLLMAYLDSGPGKGESPD